MSVQHYAGLIRECIPFAEAAYRDGEWRCMLGDPGQTVNGEVYTPELAAALRNTLLHPHGQWCAYFDRPTAIRRRADHWRSENPTSVKWVPDRVIMQAVVAGTAAPMFEAIRTRRVVLVGPAHLAKLPESVIGEFVHVEIPNDGTAWKQADLITVKVMLEIGWGELVLFAAGMASNLIIHRLWPQCTGSESLYDIGAALDPFCGVYSRVIYRSTAWQRDIMPRNLQ